MSKILDWSSNFWSGQKAWHNDLTYFIGDASLPTCMSLIYGDWCGQQHILDGVEEIGEYEFFFEDMILLDLQNTLYFDKSEQLLKEICEIHAAGKDWKPLAATVEKVMTKEDLKVWKDAADKELARRREYRKKDLKDSLWRSTIDLPDLGIRATEPPLDPDLIIQMSIGGNCWPILVRYDVQEDAWVDKDKNVYEKIYPFWTIIDNMPSMLDTYSRQNYDTANWVRTIPTYSTSKTWLIDNGFMRKVINKNEEVE